MISALRGGMLPVLAPLRHRNFRLFFAGQLTSQVGTWMQTVGQAWLVLSLTNSPLLLGVIVIRPSGLFGRQVVRRV